MERLYLVEEAASTLRIDASWLEKKIAEGVLDHLVLDGKTFFTEPQLQRIIEAAKVKASPAAGPGLVRSALQAFLDEECEFDPEYEEEAGKLFDRHKEWFKDNNERRLSRTSFGTKLKQVPGVSRRKDGTTRRVIYQGVRLRP